jgi:3-hydroxyacyl-CoA dehydrogenase
MGSVAAADRAEDLLFLAGGHQPDRSPEVLAERDDLLARISGDTALDALADADLVVEAIPESLEVKQDMFRQLDRIAKPEALLSR